MSSTESYKDLSDLALSPEVQGTQNVAGKHVYRGHDDKAGEALAQWWLQGTERDKGP